MVDGLAVARHNTPSCPLQVPVTNRERDQPHNGFRYSTEENDVVGVQEDAPRRLYAHRDTGMHAYPFRCVGGCARGMSPRRSNARQSRECGEEDEGTLYSNHSIVCPTIATVVGGLSRERRGQRVVVSRRGRRDETRTTTATINVGCLIFACAFTYKGLKLLGKLPLDYNAHHAARPVVDSNEQQRVEKRSCHIC